MSWFKNYMAGTIWGGGNNSWASYFGREARIERLRQDWKRNHGSHFEQSQAYIPTAEEAPSKQVEPLWVSVPSVIVWAALTVLLWSQGPLLAIGIGFISGFLVYIALKYLAVIASLAIWAVITCAFIYFFG